MSLTNYCFLTVFLIGAELLYLRIARHFGLFDIPNERSSHLSLTPVRGGGILFYLAAIGAVVVGKLDFSYFCVGLTLITLISFWDDIFSMPRRYRITIHFLAVGLLLLQECAFFSHWWILAGFLFMGVGIINAYNFMDGVNGMTAFYSLVTVGTLWYWQTRLQVEPTVFLPFIIIALLVFGYFNAQRQAICFAGDVGSISMGFIIVYELIEGINRSHTYLPILFLCVYGVDSLLTIAHRLYLRQNIFQAHRMHLYQLLTHHLNWPHLRVSALYALLQLSINGLIVVALNWSSGKQLILAGLVCGCLSIVYTLAKKQVEKVIKKESVSRETDSFFMT